jgi:uncharacterized protein (DUF952 family)
VTGSLLHLIPTEAWRAALAAGVLAPTHGERFVHLSTAAQVALPAGIHFAGRTDVSLLAVDPTGLDIRYEPGTSDDPVGMSFPHAYSTVATSAVVSVLPYRPGPAGFIPPPTPPTRADTGLRAGGVEPSVLRRAAEREVPVTGGVAVLTPALSGSRRHNQLLLDVAPDHGAPDAATVAAEADQVLGGAGLTHRTARLTGPGAGLTAAGLSELGWSARQVVTMAAPARGGAREQVVQLDHEALCDEAWSLGGRDLLDAAPAERSDPHNREAAVVDLRFLAVHEQGRGGDPTVVGSALLRIDGATAQIEVVRARPAHADALVAEALAIAAAAGCDLVVLDAAVDGTAQHRNAQLGFTEVGRWWQVGRL